MIEKFKAALICGGPSLERGISLNSARSVLDHLSSSSIEVIPYYLDEAKNAYAISPAQLYSNTPSDFDFKLNQATSQLSKKEFISRLKTANIVFPVMHGSYGEDGGIQRFLQKHKISFIGSDAKTCRLVFDKFDASSFISKHGFFTLPSIVLKIYHTDHQALIKEFFSLNNITRAIVKPANGGSSIGVFSVTTPDQAKEKVDLIFSKRMDTRVVIEPFVEGTEFTAIILQNRFSMPVCILPTEIETDYTENQIFDFRKKYLPTRQVSWHCPPRFSNGTIERIQVQAEQLFTLLNMQDFARFDGWLTNDGNLLFSDFNPISGMEQNSFIFQQTSRIGMSHADTLLFILKQSCARQGIKLPKTVKPPSISLKKKDIALLFGGSTSEKQVSLMTGTNAWLKLRQSKFYNPKPYLLDTDDKTVWHLPYAFALNHTVEEIIQNCKSAKEDKKRLHYLLEKVKLRLALDPSQANEKNILPTHQTLTNFIEKNNYVFLGLHGGDGENGIIARLLEDSKKNFNGSSSSVASLCANKAKTNQFIAKSNINGIKIINERLYPTTELISFNKKEIEKLWSLLNRELESKTLIIKPVSDGCSTGVAHLFKSADLYQYLKAIKANKPFLEKNTLLNQPSNIELPKPMPAEFLLQAFIETDKIKVVGDTLKYKPLTHLLEITIGVLEENEKYHVLNLSLTIANGEILTVEEKFQGGTGINITPPPENIISLEAQNRTKEIVSKLSAKIGIKGYARIDGFINTQTGELTILEINTLPALTASTVLFHQALSEINPIYPLAFLEKIIKSSY